MAVATIDRLGGQRRDPRRQFLRAGDEQAAHARAEQERIDGPTARRGPAHLVVHLGERTVGRDADDVFQVPERAAPQRRRESTGRHRRHDGPQRHPDARRHERVDADLVAAHEERAVGREPMALTTQRRRDHPCVAEDPRDRAGAGVEPDPGADDGHGAMVAGPPGTDSPSESRTRVDDHDSPSSNARLAV